MLILAWYVASAALLAYGLAAGRTVVAIAGIAGCIGPVIAFVPIVVTSELVKARRRR